MNRTNEIYTLGDLVVRTHRKMTVDQFIRK